LGERQRAERMEHTVTSHRAHPKEKSLSNSDTTKGQASGALNYVDILTLETGPTHGCPLNFPKARQKLTHLSVTFPPRFISRHGKGNRQYGGLRLNPATVFSNDTNVTRFSDMSTETIFV